MVFTSAGWGDRTRGWREADRGLDGPLGGAEKGIPGRAREKGWAVPLLGPRSSLVKHRFVHLFRVYLPITHVSHACGTSRNNPTRRAVGPGAPPPPHPTLQTSHASTPTPTPGARSHTHTHRLAHTHPPPHSHTNGGDGLGPDRKYPINVYPVTHGAESRASGGLSAMGPGGPVLKTPTQARGRGCGRSRASTWQEV